MRNVVNKSNNNNNKKYIDWIQKKCSCLHSIYESDLRCPVLLLSGLRLVGLSISENSMHSAFQKITLWKERPPHWIFNRGLTLLPDYSIIPLLYPLWSRMEISRCIFQPTRYFRNVAFYLFIYLESKSNDRSAFSAVFPLRLHATCVVQTAVLELRQKRRLRIYIFYSHVIIF